MEDNKEPLMPEPLLPSPPYPTNKELPKPAKKSKNFYLFIIAILILGIIVSFILITNVDLPKNKNQNLTSSLSQLKPGLPDRITGKNNLSNSTKCLPIWNCSTWSNCSNGYKNQTCIDMKNCTKNMTITTNMTKCCNWTCDDWSECYPANFEYRKCSIDLSCNESEKPNSRENCTYVFPCTDSVYKNNFTQKGFVVDENGVKWEDNCQNDIVIKVSCDKSGRVLFTSHLCDNQCIDGACFKNSSLG